MEAVLSTTMTEHLTSCENAGYVLILCMSVLSEHDDISVQMN